MKGDLLHEHRARPNTGLHQKAGTVTKLVKLFAGLLATMRCKFEAPGIDAPLQGRSMTALI